MRLAYVTSLLPTGRPDTGFEIANAAVLGALREAGCDITLFGILRPGETADARYDCVVLAEEAIENAGATRRRKAEWLLRSLVSRLPVIAAKLAPLAGKLRTAMDAAGPFDACIVNSAPVAAAFPELFERYPCLLVAHNVEHVSAQENAATAGGFTGALYAREARLLKRQELRALARSRFVFCLAEEDRNGFGVDIRDKSAVFPLLTPQGAPLPAAEPAYDIGLIGTWTWQPNLVGLRWFTDEVAPRLPKEMKLAVAGRLPPGLTSRQPNLAMLGRVPDAAAFVASCRIMALTSRSGTGIQLKTIETFQLGKPSVATRSSVRGFDALPMNCLVADDPESFAAAAVKLVNDLRSERTLPVDGADFIAHQQEGMRVAVSEGLAALVLRG